MDVAALSVTAALLVGLFGGAVLVHLVRVGELKYLRAELRVAQAQIAHAVVKDGAVIPPRLEEVEPIPPLPSHLQELVDQWEGVESKAVEESKIRNWLAEGWGDAAIMRQYGVKADA